MKFIVFFFFILSSILFAQEVKYEISFPNLVHHEAEIKIIFSNIKSDTLKLIMSRASPGRYALHEFAKNIYNVKAFDEKGNSLKIIHNSLNQWDVTGYNSAVIFSYTLYSDRGDGTYSQINTEHVHLNIPSAFMWANGFEKIPLEIKFNVPDGKNWEVATQLKPTDNPFVYTAPGLYYFMDSPVEISNHYLYKWTVESNEKNYNIRLSVHSDEDEKYSNAFEKLVEAVVLEAKEIWGALPNYDFDMYTFLCDYVPYASSDGMEHRNSAFCISTKKISSEPDDLINSVAHEFFHCWNVKRLRPKSLEPFDFTNVNISGELWFAEGFTSYYENIITTRAGIYSFENFAKQVSKDVGYLINSPAKKYFSPVEMSRLSPFADGAFSIDPVNRGNTYISYYTWGAALGLALDLSLRKNYPGKSLDDFMKLLWKKYGSPEIPYTNVDLQNTLAELTGDKLFADTFFNKYIYGKELPGYDSLLAESGLILNKPNKDRASAGMIFFNEKNGKLFISSPTIIGTPLYNAGLDRGDRIIKIDTFSVNNEEDWDNTLNKFSPGDKTIIEYEQTGKVKTSQIVFETDNKIEIIPFEQANITVNDKIKNFRQDWLGNKSPNLPELVKYCPVCKRQYEYKNTKCLYDGSELKITE